MSFYGDLASIDLSDLLQNLETNGRTGTLSIQGEWGEAQLYLQGGRIALLATHDRPALVDMLVDRGVLTAEQLAAAKKKRRGSRRSLGETVVAQRILGDDDLRQAAQESLVEDVCNLLATAEGEFQFAEGPPPARTFDPEERRLQLSLPVGPLILEAARRADHWVLIRKVIPSDSVFLIAGDGATCPDEIEDPELGAALLEVLDGTRDVAGAVALFPQQRFQAYGILARFVRERVVRAAEADELVAVARKLLEKDPTRARRIVGRGLEAEPHQRDLLGLEIQLAESDGDLAAAASALKMRAHLHVEDGNHESARADLDHARQLNPVDTAVRERLLALAITEDRREDAVREGGELAELYREPGLHAKALEVLERLVKIVPDSFHLRRQMARCLVDSGDPQKAVKGLVRCGKELVSQERYLEARQVYEDVIEIDPGRSEAAQAIQLIDQQVYASRRARRRRLVRLAVTATAGCLLAVFLLFETTARMAYLTVQHSIRQDGLIEDREYGRAIVRLLGVRDRYPFTFTTRFDVQGAIDDYSEKGKQMMREQRRAERQDEAESAAPAGS